MKKYKAIFFDWDGTAVMSRKAPVDEAIQAMRPLLQKDINLVIVSGTTIENIAGGEIEQYFTVNELQHLFLGLGRGAYNYSFDHDGKPYVFRDRLPEKKLLGDIHRICFDIHMNLLEKYDFMTDIVFSRPNYCKIDLMVDNQRGDNLFMQENEIDILKNNLEQHGIHGGLRHLLKLSHEMGKQYNVEVAPTCDAKYLEIGISSKSDNVDTILPKLMEDYGIATEECAYWGDEFVGIEPGIFGSDSFMKTEKTRLGDFYDVSEVSGERPTGVKHMGGGVKRFIEFLKTQGD